MVCRVTGKAACWGVAGEEPGGQGHVMASLYTIFRSLNCIPKTLGRYLSRRIGCENDSSDLTSHC